MLHRRPPTAETPANRMIPNAKGLRSSSFATSPNRPRMRRSGRYTEISGDLHMSAIATTPQLHRSIGFYESSLGKKVVMAVTGVILFGYVLAHLIGNLQIYSSDHDQINQYAHFLHSHPVMLWAVRALLFASVVLHITASIQLWRLKQNARPDAYVKKDDVPTSYAARTMIMSGPIIAFFVVFHVLHLTVGSVLPLNTLPDGGMDVRTNVIAGFQHPIVAIFYIIAMALLCMHLYHGLWSMFQSLGVNHPRYTPIIKKCAAAFAWFVAIGNISIPVAVLAGILTLQ
jgi:succinate dehydrogenase / fumarate reductase cytochrome b subunit